MKKSVVIVVTVLLISAVVVSTVLALSLGNVDGIWGNIDAGGVTVIDSVGDISVDPGTEWGTGDVSTANNTLRKKSTVCAGDTNPDDIFTPATNWDGFAVGTYGGLGSHTTSGCTPTDLIISEYVEGNYNNQAIEVYNGTSAEIDLRKYSIVLYDAGSTDAIYTEIIFLNGKIAPGATHVIVNSTASATLRAYAQQLTAVTAFDGDDTVVLRKGNESDATDSRWASGNGDGATLVSDTYWDQTIWNGTTYNTDENQVRYGQPTSGGFGAQSGLGFDGRDGGLQNLAVDTPFWLGRVTHYNNPINRYIGAARANGHYNNLVSVPISIQVTNIVCGNGLPPNEGGTLTFTYGVVFEETPNEDYCPYGNTGDNGCNDRVTVSGNPPATSFTCDDNDEPDESNGIWTIQLLGFQSHTSTDCSTQTYNAGAVQYDFITQETTDNNACLWAKVTAFVPSAVVLSDFTAESNSESILLSWETVSETDTLGFNLYRAPVGTPESEKVLVNQELIPSAVAPGSLEGAKYEFEDQLAEPGVTYLYWLEEVELDGGSTLYGPVTAER